MSPTPEILPYPTPSEDRLSVPIWEFHNILYTTHKLFLPCYVCPPYQHVEWWLLTRVTNQNPMKFVFVIYDGASYSTCLGPTSGLFSLNLQEWSTGFKKYYRFTLIKIINIEGRDYMFISLSYNLGSAWGIGHEQENACCVNT